MGETDNKKSRSFNEWVEGLKSEFHKIAWLDKMTVGKQTLAVIIVSVILGIIIAVLDMGIQHGINILVNL